MTLNADSTYQYSADYLERKDGHDEASGIFKVLANNVVEITRPSSGETSYYKVAAIPEEIRISRFPFGAVSMSCTAPALDPVLELFGTLRGNAPPRVERSM